MKGWLSFPIVKCCLGLGIGIGLAFVAPRLGDSSGVSIAILDRIPTIEPTEVVKTHLAEHPRYFVEQTLAVRQIELNEAREPALRYWSPKEVDQWATIDYHLPVQTSDPLLAVLDVTVGVHVLVDPQARAEVWLRSEKRPRWQRVILCSSQSLEGAGGLLLDVTPWLQGAEALDLRFRLLGTRSLVHPDPNTPIGPAGAQALRSDFGSTYSTIQLKLWADDD